MHPNHIRAMEAVTRQFQPQEDVLAVLVGGSIAHGFAADDADLDILIVLTDAGYERAAHENRLFYYDTTACDYPGGYVDGKCITLAYIRQVIESGSEPARFAFAGAFPAFSKVDGLEDMIRAAARYPTEKRQDNINRFYAQFETWKWYYYEGIRHENRFLSDYCLSQYVLFAGRLFLALNATLYPSYKWFLRVLEQVADKPADLMDRMHAVVERKDAESVEALYRCVMAHAEWYREERHWCERFMLDSQLNWLDGPVPVAEL